MTFRTRRALCLAGLTGLVACGRSGGSPSFVLAVLDTTRGAAVSAYGAVSKTTLTPDALAGGGLRYTNAYSNANWTLPSHASLFTGLTPSGHGLRNGCHAILDSVRTLAEQLREHGYETIG